MVMYTTTNSNWNKPYYAAVYARANTASPIAKQASEHRQSVRNEAFCTKLASWYGMYKQAEEEKAKKVTLRRKDEFKRRLASLGSAAAGTALGGYLGYLAGGGDMGMGGHNLIGVTADPLTRQSATGLLSGMMLGGGLGKYVGDRIGVANGWLPEELAATPGRVAANLLGAATGGLGTAVATHEATDSPLVSSMASTPGFILGAMAGDKLYDKLTGHKYPTVEIVDE